MVDYPERQLRCFLPNPPLSLRVLNLERPSFPSKVLTALVTAIALLDVIWGFGARARIHQDLYRRFSELAIAIQAS
jgi:hypothetical protein